MTDLVPTLTEAQWAWTVFDAGTFFLLSSFHHFKARFQRPTGSFGFYTATYNTIVQMWLYNSATWYGGMTPSEAAANWSYAVTFTTLLTSILSPLTGHIADKYSLRRAAVALFVLLSPAFLVASAMERDMHVRLLLVSLGYSCYNLHFTFFFSLLPSICGDIESEKGRRSKAHELSILSTAISNFGAAMLLGGVVLFVQYAQGTLHTDRHGTWTREHTHSVWTLRVVVVGHRYTSRFSRHGAFIVHYFFPVAKRKARD